jgi:hypothetical protein
MRMSATALVTSGVALLTAVSVGAQEPGPPPNPTVAVKRACDAAGGLGAFEKLGVLQLQIRREEVTQDGKVTDTAKIVSFLAPGPTPGRTEDPNISVVAGDDGRGGWALVKGRPDARPTTTYMVKRLLTTELFPLLLPFSLTWEGVTVSEVEPAESGGRSVWRLKVHLAPSFFHTPQISTTWTVDLDRRSFALVGAESPATDLGKGMKADGMRFSWREPLTVRNVRLRGYQRVVGLDEVGREKSHSRIDQIAYKPLPPGDAEKLFANPIPPEKRPKAPMPQPPPAPGGTSGA